MDDTTEYRIAVNVESQLAPSEVEYLVDADFRHPITAALRRGLGFFRLGSQPTTAVSTSSAAISSTARACGRSR